MRTLTVTRVVPASRDVVFEAFTDHERLSDVFGVRSCALSKHGSAEKNGLDAVREVDCGPLLGFTEEIVGFARPTRMNYKIIAARPPMDHDYGQVDFLEVPGGTKVTWTTRLGIRRKPRVLWNQWLYTTLAIAFRLTLRTVEKRAVAAETSRAAREVR
ncbi:SRPBCC family protein [Aeromicrobium sp. PE09-221]|uniref:SRPBCC family protein n=1 Tax=Aeromicrobium sp. PE09-221 TaxID=1898043 RepID=UPI000B3E5B8B|nr:SRPBCC family protein [Aeromicrobium sp. PE09-221]